MGDHGIVSSYRPDATGTIQPGLLSPRNDPAQAWGLALYRSTLSRLDTGPLLQG